MAFTRVGGNIAEVTAQAGSLAHNQTIQDGDLVLFTMLRNTGNDPNLMSVAAGTGAAWITIDNAALGINASKFIAYKIANASEPASYTYDTGRETNATITVEVWRADGDISLGVSPTSTDNNAASGYDAPSISVADNSLAFAFVGIRGSGATDFDGTADNSYTVHQFSTTIVSQSAIASRAFVTAGATGITQLGPTTVGNTSHGVAFSFVEAASSTPTIFDVGDPADVDLPVPTVIGAGTVTVGASITGTGAVLAPVFAASGTGLVSTVVTGTGAIVMPAFTAVGFDEIPAIAGGGGGRRRQLLGLLKGR